MTRKLNVLLIGYILDGNDVGESYVGFKFAEALSKVVNLTVLSLQRRGTNSLASQLPQAEVLTWDEPAWLVSSERLNAMLKPAWFQLLRHARRWIATEEAAGRRFDIGHQIGPHAPRYPSPFYGQRFPYIIGPVGGGVQTPASFDKELGSVAWYTRMRAGDQFRLRYDRWLRRSLAGASVIVGEAPYVREVLRPVAVQRIEYMCLNGIDAVAPVSTRSESGGLRILHVGRVVRTKGLRDLIRALPFLADIANLSVTSAGDGEDMQHCKDEAERLGVSDKVTFLGRIPRSQVENLYREADIFVFPSFREPSGGVLYEAMRYGLPIVTVGRGGPGYIIDDTCGIRLEVTSPSQLAKDIAEAIRKLCSDPELARTLGMGGRRKVEAEGLWSRKAEILLNLYEDVLNSKSSESVR